MSRSSLTSHLQPQTVTVQFEPPRCQGHVFHVFTLLQAVLFTSPRACVTLQLMRYMTTDFSGRSARESKRLTHHDRDSAASTTVPESVHKHTSSYLVTDGPR